MARKPVAGRLVLLGVFVLVVLATVTAACGSGSSPTSSSPAPGSLGTISIIDLELTWSPAEAPPATDSDRVSSYLEAHNAHMLFPSAAPVAGRSSVEFAARSHSGSNAITLVVTVRIDDDATPLLSLSSYTGSTRGDLAGEPVAIRGVQGLVDLVPNAVSFLEWQEQGQRFIAEFTSSDYEQMVSWLNEWRTMP